MKYIKLAFNTVAVLVAIVFIIAIVIGTFSSAVSDGHPWWYGFFFWGFAILVIVGLGKLVKTAIDWIDR